MGTPNPLLDITSGRVDRVIALARTHLGMDVAYVAAFDGDTYRYLAVDGDAASFGVATGGELPLGGTYCAQMVENDALRVIPDTAAEPRVRDLAITRDGDVGAYVGVPIRLVDGSLFGTFCCLSHRPDGSLGRRDAQFMAMLADLVGEEAEPLRERAIAAAAIRRLLYEESVETVLQPVVDLTTRVVLGMEALSRFPAPHGRPDVVFAAAETVGLGLDLERIAVTKAVERLPTLDPSHYLAVNVTPAAAIRLAALAPADGVPYERLVAEITEHAAVPSYEELRCALQPLRDRGLRVAIDDAGAGFASLQHVVELHPDIVKIDRSLVDRVSDDPARRGAVASFVVLGEEVGAVVVAEGVEREEDATALERLGVRAAQGYLFGRPA